MKTRSLMLAFAMASTSLWSGSGEAATLIESRDSSGAQHRLWIEGTKVRLEMDKEKTFLLMDTKEKKIYSINPVDRELVDMSSLFTQDSKNKTVKDKVKIQFTKKAKGPVIAGYETEQFELLANGKKCSDEYLSIKAMDDIAAKEVLQAMAGMGQGDLEGPSGQMLDPCELAQGTVDEVYLQNGFPLKIVAANGTVDNEVIKLTKNVTAPEGGFAKPNDYKEINMAQMMEEPKAPAGEVPDMFKQGKMPEDFNSPEVERMIQEMTKNQGK